LKVLALGEMPNKLYDQLLYGPNKSSPNHSVDLQVSILQETFVDSRDHVQLNKLRNYQGTPQIKGSA
jgi:hypothetical protein